MVRMGDDYFITWKGRDKLIRQISSWKIATTITFLAGLALGMLAMHEIVASGAIF